MIEPDSVAELGVEQMDTLVIESNGSYKDRPVDPKMLIFGEVGLSGEVRAVSQASQRVNEAAKLGFTACVLPSVCLLYTSYTRGCMGTNDGQGTGEG